MGAKWLFFFGEEDSVLVSEIAKVHKIKVELVEKHYKEMLKAIEAESYEVQE